MLSSKYPDFKSVKENIRLGRAPAKVPVSQSSEIHQSKQRRGSLDESSNISLEKIETRSRSSLDHNFLQKLKEIQEKAKKLIQIRSDNSPDIQKSPNPSNDSIEIPILVPLSVYRKSHNLSPPIIHQSTKGGEVLFVHLVSDQCKINNPLIKTNAKVERAELKSLSKSKKVEDIVEEIKKQFNSRSASVEIGKEGNCFIPKEKTEHYMFRDIPNELIKGKKQRIWVKDRMDMYSSEIKKNFLPKIDERKQLELTILQEKRKKFKPTLIKKLKIIL